MRVLAAFVLACSISSSAVAQDFPTKPVRIVVPYPPGGNSDIVARLVADQLGRLWARPVVVDNKPGAGGTLGTDFVAKAAPDGYTMLVGALATNATAPSVYPNLPYDPVKDFTYIAPLTFTPNVLLVNPKLPVRTLRELADHLRANPGKLNFSSPGIGISNHLAMEYYLKSAGLQAVHVPYKGSNFATAAVLAGEVQMTLDPVSTSVPHVRSGGARALAVSSAKRSPLLPEVPTFAEAGAPGIEAYSWTTLAMPAGTPAAIVNKVRADVATVLKLPEVRDRFLVLGSEIVEMPPEQFSAFIRSEAKKWGDIARAVGAKAE
jgi:tripartite-type tricarboxylate transporter receptor subunit TctC